jgi:hypothetical protein
MDPTILVHHATAIGIAAYAAVDRGAANRLSLRERRDRVAIEQAPPEAAFARIQSRAERPKHR